MTTSITKLHALWGRVRNPLPAVLDRLGLRRSPYQLELKDGYLFELRPRAGDLFGLFEIMLRGDYMAAGQEIIPGTTVIDVGANIGCFTVLASRAVGPTGRVIAVEPDKRTYEQLLKNIKLNRLSNVTALQVALGEAQATVTLHAESKALFSSLFSSVNGRPTQGREERVRMTTLRALMDEQAVETCGYLKLDCEGAEHGIIHSLSPELAARIAQITMELHQVPGFDSADLLAKLKNLGYDRVGEGHLPYYRRAVRRLN